jgi:hypothetical protein
MHPFCGRLVSENEGHGATYTCQELPEVKVSPATPPEAPEVEVEEDLEDTDAQDATIMQQIMTTLFGQPAVDTATFVRDEVVAWLSRTGMDDEGLSYFIDFSLDQEVAEDFFPQGLWFRVRASCFEGNDNIRHSGMWLRRHEPTPTTPPPP